MKSVIKLLPWILLLCLTAWVWQINQKINTPTSQANVPNEHAQPTAIGHGNVTSFNATVEKTAPAVVNIFTTQKIKPNQLQLDPFFRRFFGDQMPQQPEQSEEASSLGSGVIVSKDGYILTNNHVVEQADSIVVALHDGRKVKGTVVGTDPDSDLAVIHVNLTNLPALPFKHSPNLVGDFVLAIGNPFGVGQTVTHGIISATGRSGLGINQFEDFIQTDAPINPGNSGGALVDIAGNLVGINTAIYSRSGGSMGIGFAIPASLAEQVMQQIIKDGHVTRGWLGVSVKDLASDMNTTQEDDKTKPNTTEPSYGVKIMGLVADGPADKGGMEVGDIVLEVNGIKIGKSTELIKTVSGIKPKTTCDVLVLRNNEKLKLKLTVEARPNAAKLQQAEESGTPQPQDSGIPEGIERFFFGR